MRKQGLINLLITLKKIKNPSLMDQRITQIIYNFLLSDNIRLLNDHDEIPQGALEHYLSETHKLFIVKLTEPDESIILLKKFIANSAAHNSSNRETRSNRHLWIYKIRDADAVDRCFDHETLRALSSVSTLFNNTYTRIAYWKEKLRQAGCPLGVLESAIETQTIDNYSDLYHAIQQIPLNVKQQLSLSDLLLFSGSPKAAEYAINRLGVTATTSNATGLNALEQCAYSRNISGMLYIRDQLKMSPSPKVLLSAAFTGNVIGVDFAHYVLNIPINASGPDKYTAFMLAAIGNQKAMLHKLKHMGALVDAVTLEGDSILHLGATFGHQQIVAAAIDDFNLNPFSKEKSLNLNVLLLSAKHNHLPIATYFFNRYRKHLSFDANCIDKERRTFLHLACQFQARGHDFVEFAIHSLNIDKYKRDSNGLTAFHLAALSGNIDAMTYLADAYHKDHRAHELLSPAFNGLTAIHLAAGANQAHVFDYLVDSLRMPIETRAKLGLTPLLHAVQHGHINSVKTLLAMGADPDIVDDQGNDITHYLAMAKMNSAAIKAILTDYKNQIRLA